MPSKEYLNDLDWPHLRSRTYLEKQSGDVTCFLIKLEYNLQSAVMVSDDWRGVARFDHNPNSINGHDIASEGLHLDILDKHGNKIDVRRGFPSLSANKAVRYCQQYFRDYGEDLAADFEAHHNIQGEYWP